MIRRIATAAVYVADQAAALRFWTEQAGFEEKRRLPMGPAGGLRPVGIDRGMVVPPSFLEPLPADLLAPMRTGVEPG